MEYWAAGFFKKNAVDLKKYQDQKRLHNMLPFVWKGA